jgi:histidine triad (HIT) family protein
MDASNMSPEEILELQKQNCIFCKIISGEIPSVEIYSDEKVLVILDINPANEGHCIILPKQHYQILPQIPKELVSYMFKIAKLTSRLLLRAMHVQGTSIFVANGALAGQKAPHFMVHVIPRKPGDMLMQIPKNPIDEERLVDIQEMLKQKLGFKSEQKKIEQKPEKKQEKQEKKKESKKEEKKPEKDSSEKDEQVEKEIEKLKREKDMLMEAKDFVEKEEDKEENKQDKNNMNIDDIANMFLDNKK